MHLAAKSIIATTKTRKKESTKFKNDIKGKKSFLSIPLKDARPRLKQSAFQAQHSSDK